uniref:CG9437 protein n=1 Tax=Drosophila melanogaster TaxID=7227 RepID=A0AQG0_DROME|nr:CG9437 [Drosophila melanogaster]
MSSNHRPLDDSDILLIQTIRETPSLYDPQLPSFRLSQRKEEDWAKVADLLNISISDARRRWTCLRDRYSRELKQKRLHPSGEFGHNDFFRKMDFLRDFVRKRRERRGRERDREQKPTGWMKVDLQRRRRTRLPIATETLIEEQGSHAYDEGEEQHDYDAKLESHTTQSETYSVVVEADDGQEPEQESFDEFLGDAECEQKVKVVTIHPEIAAPNATSAPEPIESNHADLNYLVCMPPNANQEREHSAPELPNPTAVITQKTCETEDDFFCKSIAAYLRQLSRVHKIKAKVEMYQILEKYILLEECGKGSGAGGSG